MYWRSFVSHWNCIGWLCSHMYIYILENLDTDGWKYLKLQTKQVRVWIGFIWPTILEDWSVLVNAVKNLRVPQNVGYFLNNWGNDSFCRRELLQAVGYFFCIYKLLFARLNYYIRLTCKLAYWVSWNVLCWPTFFPLNRFLCVCVCVRVCVCVCVCVCVFRF